jgi:hypothetical protein
MKKLIALLLLLPILASADPEPWMKKEDPDELFVGYRIDDHCELTRESIKKIVEGVLVRSRIKPVGKATYMGLLIDFQCGTKDDDGRALFTLSVDFLRTTEVEAEYYWARMDEVATHESFGRMNSRELEAEIKFGAEVAITDYLKANFDLGE